jgi:hypothetical protein
VKARRIAPGAVLVAVVTGCGGSLGVDAAAPTVRTLDWHDDTGVPGARVVVQVRTFTVERDGWRVRATVTNDTHTSLAIGRIHSMKGAHFGIAELSTDQRALPRELLATRFVPTLPRVLTPGDSWAGVFSGRGRVPRRRDLHVVVGTFFAMPPIVIGGRRFSRFNAYSDRSVRLS